MDRYLFNNFLFEMDARLFAAVRAAEKGRFAAYCREIGAMPDRLAGEINEIFLQGPADILKIYEI